MERNYIWFHFRVLIFNHFPILLKTGRLPFKEHFKQDQTDSEWKSCSLQRSVSGSLCIQETALGPSLYVCVKQVTLVVTGIRVQKCKALT